MKEFLNSEGETFVFAVKSHEVGHLVNLIPPTDIDFKTGVLSLYLNQCIFKNTIKKNNLKTNKKMNFIEKNVAVEKDVIILFAGTAFR